MPKRPHKHSKAHKRKKVRKDALKYSRKKAQQNDRSKGNERLAYEKEIQRAIERIRSIVSDLDPIDAAAKIAGLLSQPALGANAVRLESIQHAILQEANGTRRLDASDLCLLFSLFHLSGHSRMEDPAEDLFINLVWTSNKNHRIFEGLWEGNAFYLQRFLDIIAGMPSEDPFAMLRGQICGLLALSEELARRCSLARYLTGEEYPRQSIPDDIVRNISLLSETVFFSEDDVEALNITCESLAPFCITLAELRTAGINQLRHKPLLRHNNLFVLLIPSHISPAIRYRIIEFSSTNGLLPTLRRELANAYSDLIYETPILGDLRETPTPWHAENGLLLSDCISEIDNGHYIHLIFAVDSFDDADNDGLEGTSKSIEALEPVLRDRIRIVSEEYSGKSEFVSGLTLFVTCGWGRGFGLLLPDLNTPEWRVQHLSIYDLMTLSWAREMTPFNVFRLIDHVDALRARNVSLQNINGLLNLYGWAEDLDFHLVPHTQLDHDMVSQDRPLHLVINQNSLLNVRVRVAHDHDVHLAQTPYGDYVRVSRYVVDSYFPASETEALYGSYDDLLRNRLRSVYEGNRLNVWLTVSVAGKERDDLIYTLWDAFCKWLPGIVRAIEDQHSDIPTSRLSWELAFPEYNQDVALNVDEHLTVDSLASLIDVIISHDDQLVRTVVPQEVFEACHHPANHAEVAIITAFLNGATQLLNCSIHLQEAIGAIVPSPNARQYHLLPARSFSDHVADTIPTKYFKIESLDDTLFRIGLARGIANPPTDNPIIGVHNCTSFLNSVVDAIWLDIQIMLRTLNRHDTLFRLLENIEVIRKAERKWRTSIRALLALHCDHESTLKQIADQAFKRNGASQSSRLLLEMAVCECLTTNGRTPSKYELSRLLAKVHLLNQIGGWSDGIMSFAIKPEIKVTALGLIDVQEEFYDQVVAPFGYDFAARDWRTKADKYTELFQAPESSYSAADRLAPQFQNAWKVEYGFTIDQGLAYVGAIQSYAMEQKQAIVVLHCSELLVLAGNVCSNAEANNFVNAMSLVPRNAWDAPGPGTSMKDIVPWRFRRKQSAIYRPILQIDQSPDPLCMLAPAMLLDGYAYRVERAYEAEFDDSHFESAEMRSWIGFRRDQLGHQFNNDVAGRLRDLRWQVREEVKLDALLGMKLDTDYGDIDVFAWNTEANRILAIECKDVMFAKTPGEIARQLREFRGVTDSEGRPDRLKRHLERIEILQRHNDKITKVTGLNNVQVETLLVFRNRVPVFFDQSITRNAAVKILSFGELDRL